jgi:hypothetical protein
MAGTFHSTSTCRPDSTSPSSHRRRHDVAIVTPEAT